MATKFACGNTSLHTWGFILKNWETLRILSKTSCHISEGNAPKYYQLVSMGSGIIDGLGGSFLVILCIFQFFYHDYLFLWLAKKKKKKKFKGKISK